MTVEKKVPEIRFKGFSGEWEEKEMLDCSSKIGDGLHGTPTYTDNTGIYFINGNNLISGSIVITNDTKQVSRGEQSKDDVSLNLNTILLSINGTIGNLAWYQGQSVMLGKSVAFITLENCDNRFMYTYLQTERVKNYFSNSLTGSTIKNLGLKAIRESKVLIPVERPEQSAIGNTFQKLDSLINQHQQKHDKLSNIKKSMLEKMFPKQGETTPEIRFKGFSGEWEEKELREICTYHSSSLTVNDAATNGVYPLFDANKRIGYTDKNIQDTDYISIIKDGSGVGRIRVLPKNSSFIATMGAIKTEKSDLHFLYCCLLRIDFSKHISGATIPHVYFRDYGSENCRVPIFEEQTAIGNYFQKLDTLINQHQNQITKLNNIKQACLSKMFV